METFVIIVLAKVTLFAAVLLFQKRNQISKLENDLDTLRTALATKAERMVAAEQKYELAARTIKEQRTANTLLTEQLAASPKLRKIKNTGPLPNAAPEYHELIDNAGLAYLFTDAEMLSAHYRAKRNPEDIGQPATKPQP